MRYAFLALLAKTPAHGYELKHAFEEAFGDVWPELNFGQIYTTLSRLERDGLVEGTQADDSDRRNKRIYELTLEGHKALQAWVEEAIASPQLKNEFFMKLILAQLAGLANPLSLIEQQRRANLQALSDLNRLSLQQNGNQDMVTNLLVEGAALHLEADLKWLDLCEEKLAG